MSTTTTAVSAVSVKWDNLQRWVLLFGMVLDGSFGLLICLTPFLQQARDVASMLGLLPEPRDLWFELVGIFLLIMAFIYWMSARDVPRYLGNVVAAVIGKIASVPFYLVWVFEHDAPWMLAGIAIVDLLVCAAHIYAIGPPRWAHARAALRKASST
jgi:hypothetical protein